MKRIVVAACFSLLLGAPADARGRLTDVDEQSLRRVLALSDTGFSTVSLLTIDRATETLSWACWSVEEPAGKVSTLALIRRKRHSTSLVWSARYPGAYEPAITLLYGSSLPSGITAVLLHYQTGADDAHATMLTVDARDMVSVIGSVEGQTVDLLPWADNTIRVSPGAGDAPICSDWKPGTTALTPQSCR